MRRVLRDYQQEATDAVRAEWESGVTRTAVVHATGLGKSSIIASLAVEEARAGGRTLVLAHRGELLDQVGATCRAFGPDVGIGRVQAGRNETRRPITLASAQTLAAPVRRDRLPRPTLVVCDEAHHAASRSWIEILGWAGSFAGTRTLGVTATLVRGDRRRLGDVWQTVAHERGISWAVEQGHLVRPHARVVVADHVDLESARVGRGDYQDGRLGEMVVQDVEQIVCAWREHASDRITAAFLPTVESAHAMTDEFVRRGVTAETVVGSTSPSVRAATYARLARGETRVLCGVMVTTEGWDCLDGETEILTVSGWRGIGQVKVGDMVQSLNRDTGLLEPVPATRYVERPVGPGERMFTATSQHVDIRTSEGHEFHVHSRGSSEFETVTGTDLTRRRASYSLPLAASSAEPFNGLHLTDDEIRFIAWFMTDGGFSGDSKVEISQAKDHKDDIRALLVRLGMDFTERVRQSRHDAYPNAKPLHVFTVPRGTHGGTLRRVGWDGLGQYLNKDVADALHRMTREQFLVLWEEMLKGDGDRSWLTCDRRTQVDAYTMMAAVRGLSVSYRVRTAASGVPWFRVSIRDKRWITSDPSDPRSARVRLEEPREGEQVWCVTNRNSTLVTRRGGKVVIIGNCPPVSCVLMARPTRLPGLYQQIVGRGLRPHPESGKSDCLVLDVVGASRTQRLVTLVDLLPGAVRDTSEIDALPCPECDVDPCGCEHDPVERDPDGGRARLVGPAEYSDHDLFASSRCTWLFTRAGVRFLPVGDRIIALWPDGDDPADEGATYSVGHGPSSSRGRSPGEWLAEGLTLDQARLTGERWALVRDASLCGRDASWRRRGRPSDAQVRFALDLRIEGAETMNRARLSDEISIVLASRVLDRHR